MKSKINVFLLTIVFITSIFNVDIVAKDVLAYDVDFSYSSNGIVKVLMNTGIKIKSKLVIQSGEKKYTYNVANGKDYVNYPLQLGNGKYTVKIYENTTGSKYKNVYSESGDVVVKAANDVFLASTQQVQWFSDDAAIILAKKLIDDAGKKKIAKTKNNSSKLTEKEKIDVLYSYVVKNVDYDYKKIEELSYDYLPDIDQILRDEKGICFDYSVLLAAMLRSQGIPTKLIKGESTTTDVYHAWNEIYISGEKRWITVDTTYDAYMYDHQKKYSMEKSKNQYTTDLEF
ncbi:MAG: transglutaminase [Firmicutes bacterium HGW-Firmicutes-1]|jgi:transglutaminase-like putative cysteine protease|nr:MAG: transglutaminase [Firmicutes bacterium HGW-Firmicutes-1]